jgi:hypothetical protein
MANSGQLVYGGLNYNITMLRQAGKLASNMQTLHTQMMNDFVTAGGEFPSCYVISGTTVVWSVWDPTVYLGVTPPQWAAIAAFNH